jgi:hypothetical protein
MRFSGRAGATRGAVQAARSPRCCASAKPGPRRARRWPRGPGHPVRLARAAARHRALPDATRGHLLGLRPTVEHRRLPTCALVEQALERAFRRRARHKMSWFRPWWRSPCPWAVSCVGVMAPRERARRATGTRSARTTETTFRRCVGSVRPLRRRRPAGPGATSSPASSTGGPALRLAAAPDRLTFDCEAASAGSGPGCSPGRLSCGEGEESILSGTWKPARERGVVGDGSHRPHSTTTPPDGTATSVTWVPPLFRAYLRPVRGPRPGRRGLAHLAQSESGAPVRDDSSSSSRASAIARRRGTTASRRKRHRERQRHHDGASFESHGRRNRYTVERCLTRRRSDRTCATPSSGS